MRVASVNYREVSKTFRLENGRHIDTHRYCCLGSGDDLVVISQSEAHVRCSNGQAEILPIYSARDAIDFGNRRIPLYIKELETTGEIQAYHRLEEYHYRGKILHGRRVPLIVGSTDPLLPKVLGYIELSTAFLMNRPRAILLSAPFADDNGKIGWAEWNKATVRQYTNLVVRIARCVVSPEFRGLGIANILVKHAASFARKHWHIARLKPLFLEITADMLRYVPFVEGAGMHYIGDTEGNLKRVNTDMNYILSNFARVKKREILKEEAGGIVDLQVFYATQLKRIQRNSGLTRDKLLKLLLRSPHRLSDEHWSMLHRILRLPKPTFLMGLSPTAEHFIQKRIKELQLPRRYPAQKASRPIKPLSQPIITRNCSLSLSAPVMRTRSTRRVQQAFGVDRDMLTTTLFSGLNFQIGAGDVVLLCGPSGAGKTSLLSLLVKRLSTANRNVTGLNGRVKTGRKQIPISVLSPLPSTRPLINSLGPVSFEQALHALNVSGLAEAHLYVKRFRELSNGQRYRAMVARLIASGASVWIADEFCATLDPVTANIVCRNLRHFAKTLGVSVILAAANWTEFIHELKPDVIVYLRSPWDSEVFSWKQFDRAAARSRLVVSSSRP